MNKYKYFSNIEDNAVFTEENCQFCGSCINCLEGVYFDQDNVTSVCLQCLESKQVVVSVPPYIKKRVKYDSNKIAELASNPPIPWIQSNDWQVCCNDFMQYIGEWEQGEFLKSSNKQNPIIYFEKMLDEDTLKKVDDINVLWNDLGYDTVGYVFKCRVCGKMRAVCQSY